MLITPWIDSLTRRLDPPMRKLLVPCLLACNVVYGSTFVHAQFGSATEAVSNACIATGSASFSSQGWEFQPLSDIRVTRMGLFDNGYNGYTEPHEIAIWDTADPETPLFGLRKTMPAGGTVPGIECTPPGASKRAAYRYFGVVDTPVLRAGRNYVIAAFYPTDSADGLVINPPNVAYAADIQFVASRSVANTSIGVTFPTNVDNANAGRFGPSFLYVLANKPPIANAGPDQTVECTGPDGEVVLLAGSATDADEDALTFTWDVPAGVILDDPTVANPVGLFPNGITTATLTVTDGQGGVDVDDVVITVVDTSPPEVVCTTDLAALWPPKHQMVEVKVFIDATDACTAPEDLVLLAVEVSSDEPDDGLGDGDTAGDVFGVDGFTAPVDVTSVFTFNPDTASFEGTILLRAERDGIGEGRAYTVEAFLVDNSANITSTSCVIVVPHDRRK